MFVSSGTTAKTTSGDAAVDVISGATNVAHFIHIVNGGTAAGFFSIDGGGSWGRLPGSGSVVLDLERSPQYPNVKVKRTPSGSDLADVFAFAY